MSNNPPDNGASALDVSMAIGAAGFPIQSNVGAKRAALRMREAVEREKTKLLSLIVATSNDRIPQGAKDGLVGWAGAADIESFRKWCRKQGRHRWLAAAHRKRLDKVMVPEMRRALGDGAWSVGALHTGRKPVLWFGPEQPTAEEWQRACDASPARGVHVNGWNLSIARFVGSSSDRIVKIEHPTTAEELGVESFTFTSLMLRSRPGALSTTTTTPTLPKGWTEYKGIDALWLLLVQGAWTELDRRIDDSSTWFALIVRRWVDFHCDQQKRRVADRKEAVRAERWQAKVKHTSAGGDLFTGIPRAFAPCINVLSARDTVKVEDFGEVPDASASIELWQAPVGYDLQLHGIEDGRDLEQTLLPFRMRPRANDSFSASVCYNVSRVHPLASHMAAVLFSSPSNRRQVTTLGELARVVRPNQKRLRDREYEAVNAALAHLGILQVLVQADGHKPRLRVTPFSTTTIDSHRHLGRNAEVSWTVSEELTYALNTVGGKATGYFLINFTRLMSLSPLNSEAFATAMWLAAIWNRAKNRTLGMYEPSWQGPMRLEEIGIHSNSLTPTVAAYLRSGANGRRGQKRLSDVRVRVRKNLKLLQERQLVGPIEDHGQSGIIVRPHPEMLEAYADPRFRRARSTGRTEG
jgi:hypothetical protein